MANFSKNRGAYGAEAKPAAATTGPVQAKTKGKKNKPVSAHTLEGGQGFQLNAKSELFITALSTLLGERTYYEKPDERLDRIRNLTAKVTKSDPEWVEGFTGWLRNVGNMRTVTIAVACEYVAAGGPNGRQVINAACSRAEEPMEVIGYWVHFYYNQPNARFRKAPAIPQAIRKGLGDAVRRLWTEYSVMKYDTGSRVIGMANVLNLCHITPADEHQAALFQYIVNREYGQDVDVSALPQVAAQTALRTVDQGERRKMFTAELAKDAGFTWEQASGWIGGELDAAFWEAMIPNMPIFALLRNLSNFDKAGISEEMVDYVIAKLTNEEIVRKSGIFPYQIYTAYRYAPSDNWKRALGQMLDISVYNINGFEGDSLILVDCSGSMAMKPWNLPPGMRWDGVFAYEKAAIFGAALAKRSLKAGGNVDLVLFDDRSVRWNLDPAKSVLQNVSEARNLMRGGGTYLYRAVDQWYNNHDRVVILSDEQAHDKPTAVVDQIPFMHYHNVMGYPTVGMDGRPGRFHYGGFSDATFTMMSTLETYSSDWPWLVQS